MNADKAVLVICEGSHDVIFVQRVLGQEGFKYFDGPVEHLPTPLGLRPDGPISRSYILDRCAKDRSGSSVRSLNSPAKPTFESVLYQEQSDTLYVLLRRGHDGFSPMERAVVDELRTYSGKRGVQIQSWAVAILMDADEVGVDGRAKQLVQELKDWSGGPEVLNDGAWTSTLEGPIGLFVFSRPADGKGTLDDHLADILRQDGSLPLAAAELFIDGNKSVDHTVSKKPADRLKAMMTAAGQFHLPGQPLSEVISRNGPLRPAAFKTDFGKKLVDFLLAVSWSLPLAEAPPPS